MRIAIACDHRGYEAKRRLLPLLKSMGHDLVDFGCDGTGAVDYPDYAALAARAVVDGRCEVGILVDGSGIGVSIAANKVRGVRAALAHDPVTARRAREHNHCNVLCLGSDLLGEDQVRQIVQMFLTTDFGEGRHLRRVQKLAQIEEEEYSQSGTKRASVPVAPAALQVVAATPQA